MDRITLRDGAHLPLHPYAAPDLDEVRALHARSFAALAGPLHDAAQVAAHLALMAGADYPADLARSHVHLARDGAGALVASAGWLDMGGDVARIRKVFVDPVWARRGVASVLLRAVEADAVRHGRLRFVVRANVNAVPLYERAGYARESLGLMETPDGVDLPVVFMRKG